VTDITRGTQKRLLKPQGACGKLPYMSPEIYRNRDDFDGEAVDVWTVGTILFCMLSGNRSYETPHKSDAQFYWMTHGLTTLLNDWGVDLSNDAIDLLQGMLKLNPRDRLTIQEIENHPWYAEEKLPATAHSICRQYA
jgi:serine/threonine protein kinase